MSLLSSDACFLTYFGWGDEFAREHRDCPYAPSRRREHKPRRTSRDVFPAEAPRAWDGSTDPVDDLKAYADSLHVENEK